MRSGPFRSPTTARRITSASFLGDGDSDANALQFGARPHFSAGQGAIHPAFSRGMTENDGSSRSRRPSGAPRHSRLNGGKARLPILYRLGGVRTEVFAQACTDQLHAFGQAVVDG